MNVSEFYDKVLVEIRKVIVGQLNVLEDLLVVFLSGGHVLLEGVPGTAKTLMVKTLSQVIKVGFKRIQFTPDLMPSDLLGTNVFDMRNSTFTLRKGPIFTNILLADEINRTPPKTQSALLEGMEERQVTIEGERLPLPSLFMVCATQNPVEYEGTFPLPEAQLDRFAMKILIQYPRLEDEEKVLRMYHEGFSPIFLDKAGVQPVADEAQIIKCREEIQKVVVKNEIFNYLSTITDRTRKDINITLGASPRAGITMLLTGKTYAAMKGRDYLIPDDIKRMAVPVLRHRIILKPEAEIDGLTPDSVVTNIINQIEVPR